MPRARSTVAAPLAPQRKARKITTYVDTPTGTALDERLAKDRQSEAAYVRRLIEVDLGVFTLTKASP